MNWFVLGGDSCVNLDEADKENDPTVHPALSRRGSR